MDISNILSMLNQNNSKENLDNQTQRVGSFSIDNVQTTSTNTFQNQVENQNNSQNNFNLNSILPLLLNNNLKQEDMLKMLIGNNSELSTLMQFLPLLQTETIKKNPNVEKFKYVKIADYYKNQ